AVLVNMPFSDMKAFELILAAIPAQSDLQMGNSSVVRYIQLYNSRRDLRYYGNRGTSGIDGCTSTAIGFALLNERVTTLISGDIAFFYDHNAFWHEHLPSDLKVIVVNNGGGGIFRIIPGPASSNALDACFETPHQRSAKSTSEDFGLPYFSAQNEEELVEGLRAFYASDGCSILEVFTPRLENDQVLHRYFAALKD
ncbi:MAG: thiamine pyrophosphate-dependent enzyme, partial [Flavobacteriales bacterium]|nr:thiamine pyrophosphate-dependent enzyme [Flavobacteriales bacterium]